MIPSPARSAGWGWGSRLVASTLAQKHGGTLTAQSDGRDKGARFTLTLPLVKAQPESESSPRATVEPGDIVRSLKVLLVEDNEYTSSAMAQVLEVLGHQVGVATTVADALALAQGESFDLLVSDIGLPDGSGLDIARAWQGLQPGKPSVAITGYGMDEDIRCRCRDAGFNDHLTKPVNFARLEALIHTLAQKPADE